MAFTVILTGRPARTVPDGQEMLALGWMLSGFGVILGVVTSTDSIDSADSSTVTESPFW
ncbi:hypothetical protein [Streptomyces geranii]|uniref:hypothetical protein n=1 Tax=Streptomyces geranii TaxID=2058923 RepID=UPI00130072A4|nr:hypothetical protein [Streptomyces geranii]